MTRAPRDAALRLASELEPTAHVHDRDDEYRVEVDAPGLGEGDFRVEVVGRLLRVRGPDLRAAVPEASFEFLFRLPEGADARRVAARFAGGVLTIRAPKGGALPLAVPVSGEPA